MKNLGMSVVKLGSVPAPRQKAGGLPYKRCGCLSHFLGVNKSSFETFDIPWGIQPHKIHSDSFCSTFKGIGPKNRTGNNALHDRISTSWERKQFQATPIKLDLGTSLGFFCKISEKHPLSFWHGSPPPEPGQTEFTTWVR